MKWEYNKETKVTLIAVIVGIVIGFIARTWWKYSEGLL